MLIVPLLCKTCQFSFTNIPRVEDWSCNDNEIKINRLIYQIFASSLASFLSSRTNFLSSFLIISVFPFSLEGVLSSRRSTRFKRADFWSRRLIEQRKLNDRIGRFEHIKFDGIVSLAGEKWFKGKSGVVRTIYQDFLHSSHDFPRSMPITMPIPLVGKLFPSGEICPFIHSCYLYIWIGRWYPSLLHFSNDNYCCSDGN